MGCTASKLANEDTVRRCKERRRLMRDAVLSRHHFAAAHSDYLRSLRHTAGALSRFASFFSFSVSAHTPPVLLPPPSTAPPPPPSTISTLTSTTLPSPPPPYFSPPSPSIASSKPSGPKKKRTKAATINGAFHYAATPSHSSAWNWEEFYPPSPLGSEFFDRLPQHKEERRDHHLEEEDDDKADEEEDGDDRHHLLREEGSSESEVDYDRTRAGLHCDEWDDRYSRSSTSSAGEEDEQDESRSEATGPPRSNYESSMAGSIDFESRLRKLRQLRQPPPSVFRASSLGRPARKDDWRVEGRNEVSITPSTTTSLMVVVQHRDLKEIVAMIEEYFLKAAAAGDDLSELLETGRARLDRSFRLLKRREKLYHSNSVLRTLSSTLTSKPPLSVRYQIDTAALEDSGDRKSHCSTLERLFGWEKKLYEEVKAREGAKIEHEKKLSMLQNLEYKGRDIAKLDKTKAAIQRLQSLVAITSQAVTTTSSAIIKVRDEELAPQLVELCYGVLQMWRSMNQFHEVQNNIVQQVRGLVDNSAAVIESTELHRQATRDLEASVSDWHSSFIRLIKFQREYIRALYAWLRLTLFQVSNEQSEKDHYSSLVSSELTSFCDEWKQVLDRLPDTVAAEAIKSFVKVIHSISLKQTEELKIKKRVESSAKELEKKALALRNIEKKFYQSYSMAGIGLSDGGFDGYGQILDSSGPLMEKAAEVAAWQRKVEEEMARHTMAVKATKEMTMNNIQTGLPGLFQAMTEFSSMFAEALDDVCCRRGGPRR